MRTSKTSSVSTWSLSVIAHGRAVAGAVTSTELHGVNFEGRGQQVPWLEVEAIYDLRDDGKRGE